VACDILEGVDHPVEADGAEGCHWIRSMADLSTPRGPLARRNRLGLLHPQT
jgi:hypothetical protein